MFQNLTERLSHTVRRMTGRGRITEENVREAARALDGGMRGAALRPLYADLRRYRDTRDGRELPGVDELLSRLAYALGDETAGRGFADAAR